MSRTPQKTRCTGRKTNGEPCPNWAMHGQTICYTHGGAAKQNRRAATRNLTIARAQRMVELSGVDMDPIAHLLDSLHRAATLVNVWGVMVATIDEAAGEENEAAGRIRGELSYSENANPRDPDELIVTSHDRLLALSSSGEAKIHPYVVQYEVALERRAKFAKMCIDAGVSERQIQLAERMGEQLSMLFERTIAAVEGLSDAQRLQAATAYAREIAVLERPAIDGTARDAA